MISDDLPALLLDPVKVLDPSSQSNLRHSARQSQGGPLDSLRWVFAASVLQALAIHVRRERGLAFELDVRDISSVTVRQLAALVRQHQGSAGQGFEFAVADAINAGYVPVVAAVKEALNGIGLDMIRPMAIVMGIEKVANPTSFADQVAQILGERTLRTGTRGRPATAAKAVQALVQGGTAIRSERDSLAFSDLLIYDEVGSSVVTASVKISGLASRRWDLSPRAPRLWIVGHDDSGLRSRARPKQIAVAVVSDATLSLYQSSHNAVLNALRHLDVGSAPRASPSEEVIVQVLRRRGPDSVEGAIRELHGRAQTIAEVYGVEDVLSQEPPSIKPTSLQLSVVASPEEYRHYEEAENSSGLYVLAARTIAPSRQFFTSQ